MHGIEAHFPLIQLMMLRRMNKIKLSEEEWMYYNSSLKLVTLLSDLQGILVAKEMERINGGLEKQVTPEGTEP